MVKLTDKPQEVPSKTDGSMCVLICNSADTTGWFTISLGEGHLYYRHEIKVHETIIFSVWLAKGDILLVSGSDLNIRFTKADTFIPFTRSMN